MTKRVYALLTLLAFCLASGGHAWAHCQIPCGIYDDDARFTLMLEHVTTVEKSMRQIKSLSKAEKPDSNQVVRWVTNKDVHADKLAGIVTSYFMAQRVKPVPEGDKVGHARYVRQVVLLHQVLVQSMKAKQTTDLAHCAELRKLIAEFRKAYAAK